MRNEAERGGNAPRLPRHLLAVVHVLLGLVERVEVEHALVRVVLARPDLALCRLLVAHVLAVDAVLERVGPVVGQDVAWRVPPAEAQVEAAHEADRLVDDAHLLVLRQEKGDRAGQHLEVRGPRTARGREGKTHVGPQERPSRRVRR